MMVLRTSDARRTTNTTRYVMWKERLSGLPTHVQNIVTWMAIEMHNIFSSQGASKESQDIMGSPWTLLQPRKDCAF